MERPKYRSKDHGFSLIELLVALVVMGLLAALALPKFRGVTDDAREREAMTALKALHSYQQMAYSKDGEYKTTEADLATLGHNTATAYTYYDLEEPFVTGTDAEGRPTFCIGMTKKSTVIADLTNYYIDQSGSIDSGSCKHR